MPWLRCLEFLFVVLCIGGAVVLAAIAFAAIVKAWQKTRDLREAATMNPAKPIAPQSDEHKKQLDEYWELERRRWAGFAGDIKDLVIPVRNGGIDMVKEAAQWGRLGVQYALIGSGGALVALPHLLNYAATTAAAVRLTVGDAIWSAVWFIGGLLAAALCCAVAYADFQVNAAMYWANQKIETRAAQRRHFELDDKMTFESHLELVNALQATTVKTSVCGVFLALLSWICLAWGALRLVVVMAP